MKKPAAFLLLLLALSVAAGARAVLPWTEEKMREKADLIVIGTVTKVLDLDEKNSALWPGPSKLRGLHATFAVTQVIKGKFTDPALVLHYYRWDTRYKTSDTGSAMGPDINSPRLIYLPPGNAESYVLYLVKAGESAYAPVTGQFDTAYQSVKAKSGK